MLNVVTIIFKIHVFISKSELEREGEAEDLPSTGSLPNRQGKTKPKPRTKDFL